MKKYSSVAKQRPTAGLEKEIAREAKALPRMCQQTILDIVRLLKTRIATTERHSITSLKGCGKEIWKDIDAQDYVNRLRGEWE